MLPTGIGVRTRDLLCESQRSMTTTPRRSTDDPGWFNKGTTFDQGTETTVF